uniref:Phage protein n=1 Tax=Strongyloides stercoralis TaxID=6248 RepID=A0A0K0E101_STRER
MFSGNYLDGRDENFNGYDYEEYSPHIFEIAKKTAVKRKIMKELEDWLVSHDYMMNCYEKDHEGWHRFPLRRRSTPEDMEYMDQITNSSFLDDVFNKNKQHFFVDDWRDLICVKSVSNAKNGQCVYFESFGKSAERLNDADPQLFYIKALEVIARNGYCDFFSNRKPSGMPFY